MYPDGELAQLAEYKAALRLRIGTRRVECAMAVAGVERPLIWVDRALALWQRIGPFAKLAAIPAALLLKRALFPRVGIFASMLKWAPMIFSAGRAFSALRRPAQT
jgi:hypothetical protein